MIFLDPLRFKWEPYQKAPAAVRNAYDYIYQQCNKAGFWMPDAGELAYYCPGVTLNDVLLAFPDAIRTHVNKHWQFLNWFDVQFAGQSLDKFNNAFKSAFKELETAAQFLGPDVYYLAGVAFKNYPAPRESDKSVFNVPTRQRGLLIAPETAAGGLNESIRPMDVAHAPGKARQGEARGALRAPSPSEEHSNSGFIKCAESADFDAATLRCVVVCGAFTAKGFPEWGQLPLAERERVRASLALVPEKTGSNALLSAAKAYLVAFKGPKKGLANFAQFASTWLSQVAEKDPCAVGGHAIQGRVLRLDDFELGDRRQVDACTRPGCRHVVNGPTYRPPCDHRAGAGWLVQTVAVDLGLGKAFEQCRDCGACQQLQGVRP